MTNSIRRLYAYVLVPMTVLPGILGPDAIQVHFVTIQHLDYSNIALVCNAHRAMMSSKNMTHILL